MEGTKMQYVAIIMIACSIALTSAADDGDDTLRFYLSKSGTVVLGSIKSESESIIDEAGVPNYICQFAVTDVAKGDAQLKDRTIAINIIRFELSKKDRHPLIKKDAECIVFLRKQRPGNIPQFATADFSQPSFILPLSYRQCAWPKIRARSWPYIGRFQSDRARKSHYLQNMLKPFNRKVT